MEDVVRVALEMVDYPVEDIRDWLGDCVGCAERRAKAYSLRQWARRVVDKSLPNPLQYLHHLLK